MKREQAELLKAYIDAAIVAAHVPKDVIWNKNERDYTSISGDKCKQDHDYAEMQWIFSIDSLIRTNLCL